MAMTRIEFEKTFMNPEEKRVRRAFLMEALANGPNWTTWAQVAGKGAVTGKAPNFYNDLLFCACYTFFRNNPTRNRILTMRDFLVTRNDSDCGFLIDPAHYGNEEHKRVTTTIGTQIIPAFNNDRRAATSVPGADSNPPVADQQALNIYRAVYSEMWLPNGSMKAWAANADMKTAIANLGANVSKVKSDTTASFWIKSLAGRFGGTNEGSARFGNTFDAEFLGLTGNDDPAAPQWKMGRYRGQVTIGNARSAAS